MLSTVHFKSVTEPSPVDTKNNSRTMMETRDSTKLPVKGFY